MINHPPPGATVADLPGPLHDFVPHFLAFFFFFLEGAILQDNMGGSFLGEWGKRFVNGSKYSGPGAVSAGPVFSSSALIFLQL